MDNGEQHLPVALRQLQPSLQTLGHSHPHPHSHPHSHPHPHPHPHSHPTLVSQLPHDLQNLAAAESHAFHQRIQNEIGRVANGSNASQVNSFGHTAHLHPSQVNNQPQTPQRQQHGTAPYGVLTPSLSLPSQHPQPASITRLQQESPQTPENGAKGDGHFGQMKMIPNPPNLEDWRRRLFDVSETLNLTEDEFRTYFPHVDNVYSHRSTQRYKRKPFISHYWDCRLKGRPPGTPKSDDPNKKKRKRTARQRDLCEVKIKITEYLPGAVTDSDFDASLQSSPMVAPSGNLFYGQSNGTGMTAQDVQTFGMMAQNGEMGLNPLLQSTGKRYVIQRVNGNGGNGKGDGVVGPHRHTLEESDKIKKNSVIRWALKDEKEKKKTQKSYHKRASGLALATVKKHSKDNDLKLYGACFCPYVQRVWLALELKGIPYQYIEVDPYKKPDNLLQLNPQGLVPALRRGNWSGFESTALVEYLEDLNVGSSLIPPDAESRWHCRLWTMHINKHIVPGFYQTLHAQDLASQMAHSEELKLNISKLVDACHVQGPFFMGPNMSLVDVMFAPWMLRLSRVLKPYRGWPDPESGSRWSIWVEAVEGNAQVRATTSTDDLYIDSYEPVAGIAAISS